MYALSYALRNIENLRDRLDLWIFKLQFEELCQDERDKVELYSTAYRTMNDSAAFKHMLQYVLLVGNYLNSGTKKGGVPGFSVEGLNALAANKSADKSESLLSFIVKQLRVYNPEALTFTGEFMENLPPAIRLDQKLIKGNIDEIGKTLGELAGKMRCGVQRRVV